MTSFDRFEAGQHPRVLRVALRLVLRNRAHLARVGHDHPVTARLKQPADPRRVRAGFHDDRRFRMAGRKGGEGFARIGEGGFGENLSRSTEDAKRMLAIPEI